MEITPTLRAQIGLSGVMIFGALLLAIALPKGHRRLPFAGLLLAHVFVSGLLLAIPTPANLQWLTSTQSFLWINLITVTLLVALSGGSAVSCFSPLYFALPTLALLLRQEWTFIFSYGAAIAIVFCVTLCWFSPEFRPDNTVKFTPRHSFETTFGEAMGPMLTFAYAVISLLCFALTIYIGYFTSPHPQYSQTMHF